MVSKISLHLMKIFIHTVHNLHLHQVYTCARFQQQLFGLNSLEYKATSEWNQFSRAPPQITNANSTTSMKILLKIRFMQEYKTIQFLLIFYFYLFIYLLHFIYLFICSSSPSHFKIFSNNFIS